MTVKKIIIDKDNSGRRLDNYLISIYSSVPKSKIYSIIRKGEVRVNSSRVKPSYKLVYNDNIRIPPNLNTSSAMVKSIKTDHVNKHTQDILFVDNNFIIINKKSGIAVHGGSKNNIGLIDIFREKFGKNIDLCHRLDKNTSGCLVFGKNKKAVKFFNNALKNNEIKKIYMAVIKGNLSKDITVDKPIYKNIPSRKKNSTSRFTKIKSLKDTTLVDIEIFTGRTHQIRIHAAIINHPIIFDNKYGDKHFNKNINVVTKKNIALHSKSISFMSPTSKPISIKCSPPNEFNNLIKGLE